METNNEKFTWSSSERELQSDAVESINATADEYSIEVFTTGSEQFADYITNSGLKYKDFTLEEFNQWKDAVVDSVIKAQVEAERSAFKELLIKKNEESLKKDID